MLCTLTACQASSPSTSPSIDSSASPAPAPTAAASPSPSSSATRTTPPDVAVTVTDTGALTTQAILRPGPHTFRVTCARRATPTLLQPQHGYTAAMLSQDLGPQTTDQAAGAAATRLDRSTRSLGGIDCAPGEPARFALSLDAGRYWWVALRRPSDGLDEPAATPEPVDLTVTGTVLNGTLPEPDATAVASDDRSWDLPDRLPSSGTLLLRNPGENSHSLRLEDAPEGVSAQDWLEATKLGRGAAGVGSARLSPGTQLLWSYDLSPGPYVATDSSIGEHGYPQPNGAGAVIVILE